MTDIRVRSGLTIVTAFQEELKVAKLFSERAHIEKSGVGHHKATAWVESYLAHERPAGILITGFCGGLSVPVHVGDIILPEQILIRSSAGELERYDQDPRFISEMGRALLSECRRYKSSPILCLDDIVETQEARAELFRETNAEAVDMETCTIAAHCQKLNIPFFVVKVVSDDVTANLEGLNDIYKGSDGLTPATLGKWFLEHPRRALKMRQGLAEAKDALAGCLPIVLDCIDSFLEGKPR